MRRSTLFLLLYTMSEAMNPQPKPTTLFVAKWCFPLTSHSPFSRRTGAPPQKVWRRGCRVHRKYSGADPASGRGALLLVRHTSSLSPPLTWRGLREISAWKRASARAARSERVGETSASVCRRRLLPLKSCACDCRARPTRQHVRPCAARLRRKLFWGYLRPMDGHAASGPLRVRDVLWSARAWIWAHTREKACWLLCVCILLRLCKPTVAPARVVEEPGRAPHSGTTQWHLIAVWRIPGLRSGDFWWRALLSGWLTAGRSGASRCAQLQLQLQLSSSARSSAWSSIFHRPWGRPA